MRVKRLELSRHGKSSLKKFLNHFDFPGATRERWKKKKSTAFWGPIQTLASFQTYLQILKENADDAKAQKELKEDQDFARINESKRQERVQYVQEAWKQLRQQDEAFLGIRSALCQAQVLLLCY